MQACAACTAVYVGSDTSDDGSVIVARSNDYPAVWANHIEVTPAVENQPGRVMPVNEYGSVKTEIPANTYKYTSTPYMDSTVAATGYSHDAAAAANEKGVAMTMSVTAYANSAALRADPLKSGGICEDAAVDLVICQSGTAREGVNVLCGIIDRYGSSETNIAFIVDQNEAWYIEMYTGHQYAAVKLPRDKVAVFGNEFSLEYISDYEDHIISKGLFSLAEQRGFAVHGKNNEINLFHTYSGNQKTTDYSHRRTWIGHHILAPSKFSAKYNHNAMYPLCFTPDKKVSLQDVSQLMRNRFEGTTYSPDETGKTGIRVIGTDTALSAHIIQVFSNLPAEMSCVSWVSSGPQVYGVFVPVSNDCIYVGGAYGANQPASQKNVFNINYPYYLFKDICSRCVGPNNYKTYGEPVKDFWYKAESNMFISMSRVLAAAAKMSDKNSRANYITSYCNDMMGKAFETGKEIRQIIQNGVPPRSLNLDASKFSVIPTVPGDHSTEIIIKTTDLVKVYRNGTQFYATIMDGEGKYVPRGAVVTFKICGVFYNRVVGENGLVKLNINLNPRNYNIGTYYGGAGAINAIDVLPTLISENLVKYYMNDSQFFIKLFDEQEHPVAGKTIRMNINGVFYDRTTNQDGIAKLNIRLNPGTYILTATDPNTGLMASYTITVLPILTANDMKMTYLDGSQFKAKVVDGQGNPKENVSVRFNINGVFYTRTTDASGVARLNINLIPGEYIITSEYETARVSNMITVMAKD
ncbi:C69 family dipeptidase [Methanobrevibacter sp.]|uniref:C69 family dipeptidase n=1 Tax=Methanobrevibacter sp. TaxID=66852 RepID=UPI00388F3046